MKNLYDIKAQETIIVNLKFRLSNDVSENNFELCILVFLYTS